MSDIVAIVVLWIEFGLISKETKTEEGNEGEEDGDVVCS